MYCHIARTYLEIGVKLLYIDGAKVSGLPAQTTILLSYIMHLKHKARYLLEKIKELISVTICFTPLCLYKIPEMPNDCKFMNLSHIIFDFNSTARLQ